MHKLVLVITMTLVLIVSAYGQQIQYRGETSQELPISFVRNVQDAQPCVDQISLQISITCPSGTIIESMLRILGCVPIQRGQTFLLDLPPTDGETVALAFSGEFTKNGADGDLNLLTARFRVGRQGVDAQLCDSGDITWTARPVRETTPGEELKLEGAVILIDNGRGNIVTIQKSDLK